MRASAPRDYDARVPRYTSYPTAPHFHDGIGVAEYREWLARLDAESAVSLYFHVPFCTRMCWYCGCHTRVVERYEPITEYVEVLAREIELVAEAIADRPLVSHVHWGGGTPTMLSSAHFGALMSDLARRFRFAGDVEIAVEIDPRTLDGDKVAALADRGVTRASLGIQDITPAVQRAVNRVQPFEMVAVAVAALRRAGITQINFDLMYGLPTQTVDDVIATVDRVVELAPDRLAVFGYAHVPWMKTHQRMINEADLPDGPARWAQSEAAAERLVGHGYRRIGLDHFAAPGDAMTVAVDNGELRRNFQGYTTDRAEALIGFGASAIGALADGYVQNAVPFGQYADDIGVGRLAVRRGIALTADDRLRRAVIERLMCDLAVDLGNLGADPDGFADELARLAAMEADGVVEINDGRVRVTEAGRPLLRSVCAVFDRYLDSGVGRHSRAV